MACLNSSYSTIRFRPGFEVAAKSEVARNQAPPGGEMRAFLLIAALHDTQAGTDWSFLCRDTETK
jgi:hypothetical protein